ncbi:hypothetical protein ACJX0J_039369, partial [Zea mays]
VVMLLLTIIFAVVHSGMASLRESGEKIVGERVYRVLFAGISLPLAVTTIVYFINHRYDGTQLWQVQGITGIHELLWFSSFISFFFLYPSTFNLLEVAAVDKPKLHMWETGIMRITRHPQMVGQVIWCLAHTLWIGNSIKKKRNIFIIIIHLPTGMGLFPTICNFINEWLKVHPQIFAGEIFSSTLLKLALATSLTATNKTH